MELKISKNPMALIKILLLIGIFVSIYYFIPLHKVFESIYSTDILLFSISLLLSFPAFFLSTLSTWVLAVRQGIEIPLKEFFIFNLTTRFYGFFSPASMIATAMRWQKLSVKKKYASALSAISFNRFFSIVSAVFSGLFWALFKINQNWKIIPLFLGLSLLSIMGWYLITRLSPVLVIYLGDREDRSRFAFVRKLMGFSIKYFDSIKIYSTMPVSVLLWVVFLNFSNDLLGLFAHILLAKALNIPITIFDLGWVRSVSFLLSVIPFTLPGGIGIREVSLVVILSALKVPSEVATAYTFLIYSRGVVFSLICGLFAIGNIKD